VFPTGRIPPEASELGESGLLHQIPIGSLRMSRTGGRIVLHTAFSNRCTPTPFHFTTTDPKSVYGVVSRSRHRRGRSRDSTVSTPCRSELLNATFETPDGDLMEQATLAQLARFWRIRPVGTPRCSRPFTAFRIIGSGCSPLGLKLRASKS